MEFKSGDRVQIDKEDTEGSRARLRIGDTGTVYGTRSGYLVLIHWDKDVPDAYDAGKRFGVFNKEMSGALVWGVYADSIGYITDGKTRIEKKINQMTTRWKAFQQRKQQGASGV